MSYDEVCTALRICNLRDRIGQSARQAAEKMANACSLWTLLMGVFFLPQILQSHVPVARICAFFSLALFSFMFLRAARHARSLQFELERRAVDTFRELELLAKRDETPMPQLA